jgi:hypothetical protein
MLSAFTWGNKLPKGVTWKPPPFTFAEDGISGKDTPMDQRL